MARLRCIDLPGIPQHIVRRGNNRLPCFLDDGDLLRHLLLLHEFLHATGCQLHAYVWMDNNHMHLPATPPAPGRIGQLIQRLGRINSRRVHTGTLWEGLYKACLVDSADYIIRCLIPRRLQLRFATPTVVKWPRRPDLSDFTAGCRVRAYMDVLAACPATVGGQGPCSQAADPPACAVG
ncbi:transposase [Xanthomonas hortorum pv. vitians]|nr:transposase [Xanthomonas hortorum]WJM76438.1 transposase [Xanthomonas hortorum pv. vitians]